MSKTLSRNKTISKKESSTPEFLKETPQLEMIKIILVRVITSRKLDSQGNMRQENKVVTIRSPNSFCILTLETIMDIAIVGQILL